MHEPRGATTGSIVRSGVAVATAPCTKVVMPLAGLVGARIAGADVIALAEPNCSVPVLRQ